MIVTVNTDASFSWKHKRGTYAFWIICDEFKITMSGRLKQNVKMPQIAEFQCIMNALYVLFNADTKRKVTRIIINTDCLHVIDTVHCNRHPENKARYDKYGHYLWVKPWMAKYKQLLKKHSVNEDIISMRHVKSHEHTDTPRNYINQWCDDAAKEEMRKLLEQIQKL